MANDTRRVGKLHDADFIVGKHAKAFMDIRLEREAQDAKFGEQNHSLLWWAGAILQEELGELAEAMLEGAEDARLREELVQVAAVCVAALESFDRVGPLGRAT